MSRVEGPPAAKPLDSRFGCLTLCGVSWRPLVRHQPRTGCALLRSRDDADAFAEFYAAYSDRVVVFFTRRVLDVDVAWDLAGETFAKALQRCTQFRGHTPEEEQGWLFAIARGELSHYRRRGEAERAALTRMGVAVPELTDVDIERVETLAALSELRPSVAEALVQLPDGQRHAVELRVLQELSYEDMAAALGVSEDVVRTRVSRGLRAMSRRLKLLHPSVEELA